MSRIHLAVLGFLHERPMYGYEIQDEIKHREMEHWAGIRLSSVYKALHTLEERKHVTGQQVEAGNNPNRTVYTLNNSGWTYLKELVEKSLTKTSNRPDYWLSIAFCTGVVTRDFFLRALEKQIDYMARHLENEHVKCAEHESKIPFNWKALKRMGMMIHNLSIQWLEELKEEAMKENNRFFFLTEERT